MLDTCEIRPFCRACQSPKRPQTFHVATRQLLVTSGPYGFGCLLGNNHLTFVANGAVA